MIRNFYKTKDKKGGDLLMTATEYKHSAVLSAAGINHAKRRGQIFYNNAIKKGIPIFGYPFKKGGDLLFHNKQYHRR